MSKVYDFVNFIISHNGILNDKAKLSQLAGSQFNLTQDRSVFYCDQFAVRFSSSNTGPSFSNTVLSLSNLRKFDHIPFFVCLVTPEHNYLMLGNSTFLKKISHSSQELRVDNIRGSFNGSDIAREINGLENIPKNFARLFDIHRELGFEGNLPRLVDTTNNIVPSGHKFIVTPSAYELILSAPSRAASFINSECAIVLKQELDKRVEDFKNEILIASMIENVNVRGRIIEYLIAGEDEGLRRKLIEALQNRNSNEGIPAFKTENSLGDYQRVFDEYFTETDVKTKIMILSSNPKAYNLDKILEFLSTEKSVFLFYFVGVDPAKIANTVLISMFQTDLMESTILLKHWSGRNSRGVSQFDGRTIESLIRSPKNNIDIIKAQRFLDGILSL